MTDRQQQRFEEMLAILNHRPWYRRLGAWIARLWHK